METLGVLHQNIWQHQVFMGFMMKLAYRI